MAVSRKRPADCILGADTVVFAGREILGKPRDADDAFRMLRMLSGGTHEVITGVCLAGSNSAGRFERVGSETTLVPLTRLNDDEIRVYVASGEPMDKAGAYAIQGIASRWIGRIAGDYFNVVGLPVSRVCRMLQECGCGPAVGLSRWS